jgi:hypothetical protein
VLLALAAPQGKPKRARTRDERQQLLNRMAQSRYRERKRARVSELESVIAQLDQKLKELELAKTVKLVLEDKQSFLKESLWAAWWGG